MSDLERLKSLLLGPERETLRQFGARLDESEQARAGLPGQLPTLLEQAHDLAPPGRLGRAIAEPVADALGEAVSRRRQSIVDALFPIIMPAIRRAIAEYLRTLSSDINRLLESSFTRRGIGWRVESWRSGRPYAEIALKHSLRYRVDYLLLIQNETGLVLDREQAADLPELDGDAVAGMLTAIGDFVRDSVTSTSESLSSATVGEHLLWILEGPHAKLAAFIRGVPPASLKLELQARLEALHQRFDDRLGLDPAQLVGLTEIRDALTPDDLRSSASAVLAGAGRPPSLRIFWIAGIALTAALSALGIAGWRWQQRIDVAEARLRAWPGLHLDHIAGRMWRTVDIDGLIDPMAESPLHWLRTQAFAGQKVTLNLRRFVSADAEIAIRRLRLLLRTPESVQLELDGDRVRLMGTASLTWRSQLQPGQVALAGFTTLDASELELDLAASLRDLIGLPGGITVHRSATGWRLTGTVEAEWRDQLAALAGRYPELAAVDISGLVISEMQTLADINAELLRIPARFATGTRLIPEDSDRIARQIVLLQRAARLAEASQVRLVVQVHGLSDSPGTPQQNAVIRQRRAEFLVGQLRAAGVSKVAFEIDADATLLAATIPARAVVAQLRFE